MRLCVSTTVAGLWLAGSMVRVGVLVAVLGHRWVDALGVGLDGLQASEAVGEAVQCRGCVCAVEVAKVELSCTDHGAMISMCFHLVESCKKTTTKANNNGGVLRRERRLVKLLWPRIIDHSGHHKK